MHELNLCGFLCPEPVLIIRKTIRSLQNGEKLFIIADDFSTIRDIPYFCHFMEHRLLEQKINIFPYQYIIQKGLR